MGILEDLATNQTAQGLAILFTIVAGLIAIVGLRKFFHKSSISTVTQKHEFKLINISPKWKQEKKKVRFTGELLNTGNTSAREIQVSCGYYSQEPNIRKITQEKKDLVNSCLPIQGTITPNSKTSITFLKDWDLQEQRLWVVLWIRYKFDKDKSGECVFVSHVIGDRTNGLQPIYYSNEDLKDDQKALNDIVSGKTGF